MNSIIHFFGLKRSGNHAILNWVLKNAFKQSDEVLFRNCVYSPYSHPPKIIYPYDLKVINPDLIAKIYG